MPCYCCGAEYGVLKKEVGCDSCGFSFCGKCCKKKEMGKKLLCNQCYENLTGEKTSQPPKLSPPLAHKKRMGALTKQSFSLDSGPGLSSQWSNEKDKDIAERLQKLKRERIKDDIPSETEIETRLAQLKGMDPDKYKAPPIQVFRPPDKRTSFEQTQDLMQQLKEEADLDSRLVKPEDEIAARLARLRDEPKKEAESPDVDQVMQMFQKDPEAAMKALKQMGHEKLLANLQEDQDEEKESGDGEEEQKLVERLLATNIEGEELESIEDSEQSNKHETEEEFPWCVICTEDARIRCFGCDGDLYCANCFKECHDSFDIKDHRTCPFLPPKNISF